MAESADFELKLLDAATGPAKRVADALRGVATQTDRAQQAMERQASRVQKEWNSIAAAADKAAAATARVAERNAKSQEVALRRAGVTQSVAYSMNAKMDAAASKARDKAAAVIQKASERKGASEEKAAARTAVAVERQKTREAAAIRKTGLLQLAAQKEDKQRTYEKSFGYGIKSAFGLEGIGGKAATGAFWGNIAAGAVMGIAGAFVSGAEKAVGIVADGVKMAFSEGGKAENLRLSYKLLLGDAGGKAALADIGGFAGKTKYDDDAIAEMMRPLFNAGLKGQGARSAFAASGDLEAAGLGSAQDFIEQFAKIQLKGGVTDKLLVGMGVNLRDFKDALAKETGATNKDAAYKKATEGKSDPQAIMNAIYRGIENRQGGQIGTGTELASRTMSARLEKIQNLPSQYLKKVSESPAWDQLSERLGAVLSSLDPDGERGKVIVGRLTEMFKDLTTWADEALTPANLTAFTSNLHDALLTVQTIASFVKDTVTSILWVSDKVRAIGSLGTSGIEDKAVSGQSDYLSSLDADLASGNKHGVSNWFGGTSYEQVNDPAQRVMYANEYRAKNNMPPLTVNGGINVALQMGGVDDPVAAGKAVADEVAKRLQRAATQGGG